MKTVPVILGKEAILRCDGNKCSPKNTKKWLGGKNYDLLCYGNESKNSSKYAMMTNDTTFDLMIRDFSLSDANCEYTCACGFLQFTDMLKSGDGNVIYPPTVYENLKMEKDHQMIINIFITVYPLPTCEITYQKVSSPINITFTDIHEGPNGLPNVRLHHIFDLNPNNCSGHVNLTCKVGSEDYILMEERIDTCRDHQNNTHDIIILLVIVSSVVFVICITVLVVVLYCKCVKKGKMKTERISLSVYDDKKSKTEKDAIEKTVLVVTPCDREETDAVTDSKIMLRQFDKSV